MTSLSARERTPFGQFQLHKSHLATGPNPHSPGSPERAAFDARRDAWRTRHTMRPDEAAAARLTVCAWATDADDARALMDVLGILPVSLGVVS